MVAKQKLPINMVIITAIALLMFIFFILVYFFPIIFTGIESNASGVEVASYYVEDTLSYSECQDLCQELLGNPFGCEECRWFMLKPQVKQYINECVNKTGACEVFLLGNVSCIIQ